MHITPEMWWAMCEAHMARPIPLAEADLTRSFVYCRAHGLFYVPAGSHPAAMSVLLAFEHGSTDAIATADAMGLEYTSGTASYWLAHTTGAAVKSSVGRHVHVYKRARLSVAERRVFGQIGIVEVGD